jgi:hypothetical protein
MSGYQLRPWVRWAGALLLIVLSQALFAWEFRLMAEGVIQ